MKFTWKIAQVRAKEKERKSRFNKRFNEDAERQVKETAAIIAEAEASVIAMGTDRAIATCTDRACLGQHKLGRDLGGKYRYGPGSAYGLHACSFDRCAFIVNCGNLH